MTDTVIVTIDNTPIEAKFYDENTQESREKALVAVAAQVAAESARDDASAFADLAEAAALTLDNIFADTTAGLAAVSEGQYFWTPNPLKLWREVSGVAVEQDQLLVRALLDAELTRRRRVINVDDPEYGAVGNCVPLGPGLTTGTDDTAAFNAAIDALWDDWNRYVEYPATTRPELNQFAIGGPVLTGGDGKVYRVSGRLRALPPGTSVDMENCTVVADAHNIELFSLARPDDGSGVELPLVGGGTAEGYGSSYSIWKLPKIHLNGYGGTFIRIDTADRICFYPMHVVGAGESPNEISGALVNNSRFIGVAPADYDKVIIGDVYSPAGDLDWWGNPRQYLVVDKQVEDEEAIDRTYGALKLDQPWTGSTGNLDCQQLSIPMVTMKLQQSCWIGESQFLNCPWSFYHGRNRDEVTSGSNGWRNETVVSAFGLNDCTVGEYFQEGLDYGGVFGPWCIDFTVKDASMQFNRLGSHLIINSSNFRALKLRHEELSPAEAGEFAEDRNAIPGIVVYPGGVRALIDYLKVGFNQTGRKSASFGSNSLVTLDCWEGIAVAIPEMPDGSFAPFSRQDNSGTLMIRGGKTIVGPDGNYPFEPRRWCTNMSGGDTGFGYTGIQTMERGMQIYTTGTALSVFSSQADAGQRLFELGSYASGEDENAVKFAVDGNGNVYISGYLTADLLKVLGPRVQGFTQMTGTASKGALATYDAPTISGTYSQSEVQALANAVQALSRRLKAHEDALFSHGLTGA
jgi:hypothetical protein